MRRATLCAVRGEQRTARYQPSLLPPTPCACRDHAPLLLKCRRAAPNPRAQRTYERDMQIAAHVTNVHRNAFSEVQAAEGSERERNEGFLKRYIEYTRAACRPRLSEEAMRHVRVLCCGPLMMDPHPSITHPAFPPYQPPPHFSCRRLRQKLRQDSAMRTQHLLLVMHAWSLHSRPLLS